MAQLLLSNLHPLSVSMIFGDINHLCTFRLIHVTFDLTAEATRTTNEMKESFKDEIRFRNKGIKIVRFGGGKCSFLVENNY